MIKKDFLKAVALTVLVGVSTQACARRLIVTSSDRCRHCREERTVYVREVRPSHHHDYYENHDERRPPARPSHHQRPQHHGHPYRYD